MALCVYVHLKDAIPQTTKSSAGAASAARSQGLPFLSSSEGDPPAHDKRPTAEPSSSWPPECEQRRGGAM